MFVAGNVALVALELIEWPVALLAIGVHVIARSRFKAVEAFRPRPLRKLGRRPHCGHDGGRWSATNRW